MADESDFISFSVDKGARDRALNTPTLLVVPEVKARVRPSRSLEERMEELIGLAEAIELQTVHKETLTVSAIKPATYLGTGQLARLASIIADEKIELAVVDAALSPVQQRNLEKELKAKVLDRTGLILEIFGARASTKEGTLQVALAHLRYQKSRLVRSWTHLERQRGGVGFMGGPGETQIEADRRLLQDRIQRIELALEDVKRTRALHRKGRAGVPVVALVGYTNAGKSTLFNKLSSADVLAKDMLFATLDPTLRNMTLPSGREIVLSDTVGFVSHLPHELVAAFAATLEEVKEATLILHVRDISSQDTDAQAQDVKDTLAEIGLDEATPIIEVWNKIDRLEDEDREHLVNRSKDVAGQNVAVSAVTGEGLEALFARIEHQLSQSENVMDVLVPHVDGKALAWFYRHTTILDRQDGENGTQLRVSVDPASYDQAVKYRL